MISVSDLGKQTKAMYPQYAHLRDIELGKMMRKNFPGIYDHLEDDGLPPALESQLEDLKAGERRAVFVPRGSKFRIPAREYGARKLTTPAGDVFYNPQEVKPQEIKDAFAAHEIESLLAKAPAMPEEDGEPRGIPEAEDAIAEAGKIETPEEPEDIEAPMIGREAEQLNKMRQRAGDRWAKPQTPGRLSA